MPTSRPGGSPTRSPPMAPSCAPIPPRRWCCATARHSAPPAGRTRPPRGCATGWRCIADDVDAAAELGHARHRRAPSSSTPRRICRVVLAKRPNDPTALNNLAWVYQQRNDTRARAVAQKAYLIAPGPQIADTLGWILVGQGSAASGLTLLRQSAAQQPDEPSVQYHLAAALNATGQREQAAAVLRPISRCRPAPVSTKSRRRPGCSRPCRRTRRRTPRTRRRPRRRRRIRTRRRATTSRKATREQGLCRLGLQRAWRPLDTITAVQAGPCGKAGPVACFRSVIFRGLRFSHAADPPADVQHAVP